MKKMLVLLLTLCLLAGMVPLGAGAEEIEVSDYSSLKSAFENGGEIKLGNAIEVTEKLTLAAENTLAIDLNGKTLNMGSEPHVIQGKLTIKDTSSEKTGKITSSGTKLATISPGGSVTLESGTIGGKGYFMVNSSGIFSMTGGKIETTGSDGLYIYGGTANITGGSIISGAVYVSSGTFTLGETVQDGTQTNEQAQKVYIQTLNPNGKQVTLNSGVVGSVSGNFGSNSVFGCWFETDVNNRLPVGKVCESFSQSDKTYYRVVNLTEEKAEAKIDEVLYASASVAAKALKENETLTLLKDIKGESSNILLSITAPNATIDLNGHNVTNTSEKGTAIGMKVGYGDSKDGTSTVTNTSSNPAKISGNIGLVFRNGNSMNTMEVKIEGNISFDCNTAVDLKTGAVLLYTEAAGKMVGNGGFRATNNGKEYIYASAVAAMGAATDGVAYLINDYVGTDKLMLGSGKTGIVDLCGHTYTYTGESGSAIEVGTNNADSNTKLTIKNGTVKAEKADGAHVGIPVSGQTVTGVSLTLDKVTLTTNSSSYGIVSNGTCTDIDLTLQSGTVLNAPNAIAVYWPSGEGTVTIDDSTITGHTGIQVCAGSLTVKGENTQITASGTPVAKTENDGGIKDGAAISVIERDGYKDLEKVTIEDGQFKSDASSKAVKAYSFNNTDKTEGVWDEAKNVISISGGYFTSDPSEYCAEGRTGVANTGSNSSTYPFTVGESNVEVETAVAAGEPTVSVSPGIGVTADTVKKAAQAEATQTSLQKAATLAGLSNNPSVVGTKEEATAALSKNGVTVDAEATVTVVVQPYLDVKVKSAETTEDTKSMTVEISAKYNVIATIAEDPGDIKTGGTGKNAVTLKTNQDMKVTSPVTITLPLPTDFVNTTEDKVYVQHKGYEYEAEVTKTGADASKTYTATFTNPHGFSTFVLSTKSETVATVNDTDYTNFQQAVNATVPNGTIEVKEDDQTATDVTHSLTLKNGTNGPITVTINGKTITIPANGQAAFTYTPPTPPRPTEEKHSITISTDGKGQVTGPASAAEDDKVTLTVKPNADKELYDLKVTDEDGKAIAVTKVNDTTYTFTMPDGKVTVAATFGCDGGDNCPSKAFTDLGDKQWYHDSIDYAVENGLLEGTSPTTMEPNATLIRAQLAQILYNIEDKPAVTGEMIFEDVPASEWFYSPVLWANQNEIINGTSPTTFEPLEDISRQDLALMLYRYAGKPAVTGDLDAFTDADQVGDWAEEAMAWAVAEGIVQGDTPTTLNPTGTATRAEAAAMLQRFLENAA